MTIDKFDIKDLFNTFLTKSRKEEKVKMASLQLTGKIEDYLTREFIYHIYSFTKHGRFAFANLGKNKENEPKIDISIVKGESPEKNCFEICNFIEVKYLNNVHKCWIKDKGNSPDNMRVLKKLEKQLKFRPHEKHGGFKVNLNKQVSIWGLVFISYVCREKDIDKEKEIKFYQNIKKKAKESSLIPCQRNKHFENIYTNIKIEILGTIYYVSLKKTLWRFSQKFSTHPICSS